jgi:hypothetical protein
MVRIYVYQQGKPLIYHEGNTGDENSGYVVLLTHFLAISSISYDSEPDRSNKSYCH